MSKPALDHSLLHLILRAQHLGHKESIRMAGYCANEGGYAMMIVSIVTVMMFSLLAAYLTITNISRSATNAYIEGNSTFYTAESGLNRRSDAVRQKFVNYATPTGTSPGAIAGVIAGPENMAACLDVSTTNDGTDDFACQTLEPTYNHLTGTTVSKDAATDYSNSVKYSAHTFVSDRTTYTDPVRRIPQTQVIPAGQTYAGLSAQEYRYTVYSMATSKQAGSLDARATTVLEMTFKNLNIPLFQFAAFYDGDLEMNSTSQMDINGRVHTNRNLYIQPTPNGTTASTRLLGQVTAANSIYNRVDASINTRTGITRVLLTGDPNNPGAVTNAYADFPLTDLSVPTSPPPSPLSASDISAFQRKVMDGAAGATVLTVPPPGFLRKRDPAGDIGEYYGKADLRLEMVPKRAAGNVPFNFAAIRSGGAGGSSCSTFEISVGRQGTINCNQLNEGQRRSLQQPVMVKVVTNDERTRFCPTLTKNHDPTKSGERKILRALQVGIAAQNTPVPLDQLGLALSHPDNASIFAIADGLKGLDDKKSPIVLAAEEGACFLPAPILLLAPILALAGSGSGANANYSWESNYFDRREERWIGMLQTNIASLTVWNRNGLYVDRDNVISTNDNPTAAQRTAAFNSGNNGSAYDTDSVLFERSDPTTAANIAAPVRSFRRLGLGAKDTTEGGLVFHATVHDDFDDDGTANIAVDGDNLRVYPDGVKRSPYGFAFSAGADLPGPLSIVTDRGLYVQGDYNNFAANVGKQPAALIGDTITVLSNSCATATTGMIDCGVQTATQVATATSVNAAFLSYTDPSDGNIGSTGYPTIKQYSGGLNNYMRMVEDWGGINFNYTGSFVSLGAPQEYSGAYRSGSGTNAAFVAGGSYYDVPIRNFNYDTDFNAFDKLPPLTPKVIYLQQETFKRSYK